jgi:hypothetical protein
MQRKRSKVRYKVGEFFYFSLHRDGIQSWIYDTQIEPESLPHISNTQSDTRNLVQFEPQSRSSTESNSVNWEKK